MDVPTALEACRALFASFPGVASDLPDLRDASADGLPLLVDAAARALVSGDGGCDVPLRVCELFRPLLGPVVIAACARPAASYDEHLSAASALSWVVSACPHVADTVVDYVRASPHRLLEPPGEPAPCPLALEAALRLVRAAPAELLALWDVSPLAALLADDAAAPSGTRWLAARLVAASLNMTHEAAGLLAARAAGGETECELRAEAFLGRETEARAAAWAGGGAAACDGPSGSEFLVSVGGILLPRRPGPAGTGGGGGGGLVEVRTTQSNLRAVAMALCEGAPVLLEGVTGSGKTALLDECARLTGNEDMVRIHLDDQIDAKTLIGTYQCTDVPGEFRYQPGALTQAVTSGRWAVLEDVDRAPFEVLSALIPLLERRRLFLPGRGEVIEAHRGFQLFATRTLLGRSQGGGGGRGELQGVLTNHFSRVLVEPLSADDSRRIVRQKYDRCAPHADRILRTYAAFAGRRAGTRALSTRDLFKWCARLQGGVLPEAGAAIGSQVAEHAFLEAADCFAASFPEPPAAPLEEAAAVWELPRARLQFYQAAYKPRLVSEGGLFGVGRVSLPVPSGRSIPLARGASFSYTKHALRTLERIAACVRQREPVLLVGETGNGKTAVVQHLAEALGQRLLVQNLNQQSDSSDFLGGFKPVDLRTVCVPLMNEYGRLFPRTFSRASNAAFVRRVKKAFEDKHWKLLVGLLRQSLDLALARLEGGGAEAEAGKDDEEEEVEDEDEDDEDTRRKGRKRKGKSKSKRKMPGTSDSASQKRPRSGSAPLAAEWCAFGALLGQFERQLANVKTSFAFWFAEGALVRALREGHWLLLDEINLASSETLERLGGVLDSASGSVSLIERGDTAAVRRHPNFRLFANMNPPTDFGKRDLPPGIRSRFSELYVAELEDPEDIGVIVRDHVGELLSGGPVADDAVVALYLDARRLAATALVDGAGRKPHYSVRTLCRALRYCRGAHAVYGVQRALYEGFELGFVTCLEEASRGRLQRVLDERLLTREQRRKTAARDAWRSRVPRSPAAEGREDDYVRVAGFWLRGGELPREVPAHYIVTATVEARLSDLARAVGSRYPVLLQGPTSAGKTSLVEHLARVTGHRFVRINNHEHTDIQEYMGCYVSDDRGRLAFQEGTLVEAVRRGYWIVLDELNLAPSEVLEALNRLLDDNRELLIPETGEVVRPHPGFRIFATQNPPGVYGGRKVLSRAFRNRFVELHVDDLPEDELEVILERRCRIPASYSKRMVAVMRDLQRRRGSANVFDGKRSFITPRDLFRWGERRPNGYRELAEHGYMLLGERLRDAEGRKVVREVLTKHCKHEVDEAAMYERAGAEQACAELRERQGGDGGGGGDGAGRGLGGITWTYGMRRMFRLVRACIEHKEPVLLVGETGCGKTTLCQVLALLRGQELRVVNCHQHTETSDFIGGLRPVRGRQAVERDLREALPAAFEAGAAALEGGAAEGGDGWPGPEACAAEPVDALLARLKALRKAVRKQQRLRGRENGAAEEGKDEEGEEKEEEAARAVADTPDPLRDPGPSRERKRKARADGGDDGEGLSDSGGDEEEDHGSSSDKRRKLVRPAPEPAAPRGETEAEAAFAALCASVSSLQRRHAALFEWEDGALVVSMKEGSMLLVDEISLAEDAVLERLNSVLEPGRSLMLTEKGGGSGGSSTLEHEVVAADRFRVLATMNPGGDFGKKELSPALRNRFTEIWVPAISSDDDLRTIIGDRFSAEVPGLREYTPRVLEFVQWFNAGAGAAHGSGARLLSLRDILSWVDFMNAVAGGTGAAAAFVHGACLTLLDGLGVGTGDAEGVARAVRGRCLARLEAAVPEEHRAAVRGLADADAGEAPAALELESNSDASSASFGIAPFFVPRAPAQLESDRSVAAGYSLRAPTTSRNLLRVLRAMQLRKAILLEGSPGVGKTSLITALAAATGHKLVRCNLSEQTDMMDLLGMDLPVSGGKGGQFTWSDGVFLKALKEGHWVLLDELNLASQSVLEGLNAVLDHRATVFIPELGRSFACPSGFRIFAAQNPVAQGGGRKGLPKSFLNRFTKVYLDDLQTPDLRFIVEALHPDIPRDALASMIRFNQRLHADTMERRAYGRRGAPWEFNLRDVFRWCQLVRRAARGEDVRAVVGGDVGGGEDRATTRAVNVGAFVDLVYLQRFRTAHDRREAAAAFEEEFAGVRGALLEVDEEPEFRAGGGCVQVGRSWCRRRDALTLAAAPLPASAGPAARPAVLPTQLRPLEHLMTCVDMRWPAIVLGDAASGKTSVVRLLASLAGHSLHEVAMTRSADSTDLLGCFEQVDVARHAKVLLDGVQEHVREVCAELLVRGAGDAAGRAGALMRQSHLLGGVCASLATTAAAGSTAASAALPEDACVRLFAAGSGGQEENGGGGGDGYRLLSSLLAGADAAATGALAAGTPARVRLAARHAELVREAASVRRLASAPGGAAGRFEWIDGALVRALERGDWVLLENANFCAPSVLDRLNPLLETGGVLLVNECGLVDGQPRVVVPHPGFRLFLTMDPAYGEISRAMRNRCVEVALPAGVPLGYRPEGCGGTAAAREAEARDADELGRLAAPEGTDGAAAAAVAEVWRASPLVDPRHPSGDLVLVLNAAGVPGAALPALMADVHGRAVAAALARPGGATAAGALTRSLLSWARIAAQQASRGTFSGVRETLAESFAHAYAGGGSLAEGEFDAAYERHAAGLADLLAPGSFPRALADATPFAGTAGPGSLSPVRALGVRRSAALLDYLVRRASRPGAPAAVLRAAALAAERFVGEECSAEDWPLRAAALERLEADTPAGPASGAVSGARALLAALWGGSGGGLVPCASLAAALGWSPAFFGTQPAGLLAGGALALAVARSAPEHLPRLESLGLAFRAAVAHRRRDLWLAGLERAARAETGPAAALPPLLAGCACHLGLVDAARLPHPAVALSFSVLRAAHAAEADALPRVLDAAAEPQAAAAAALAWRAAWEELERVGRDLGLAAPDGVADAVDLLLVRWDGAAAALAAALAAGGHVGGVGGGGAAVHARNLCRRMSVALHSRSVTVVPRGGASPAAASGGTAYATRDWLWRAGACPTLAGNEQAIGVEAALVELDHSMRVVPGAANDEAGGDDALRPHPRLYVTEEWRRTLAEAHSTLHAVRRPFGVTGDGDKLADTVAGVPAALEREMARLRAEFERAREARLVCVRVDEDADSRPPGYEPTEEEEAAADEALRLFVSIDSSATDTDATLKLDVWPLFNLWCVRAEHALLADADAMLFAWRERAPHLRASGTASDGEDGNDAASAAAWAAFVGETRPLAAALSARAASVFEFALAYTARAPGELAPYQTLGWKCARLAAFDSEGGSAAACEAAAREFGGDLAELLQLLRAAWNRQVWGDPLRPVRPADMGMSGVHAHALLLGAAEEEEVDASSRSSSAAAAVRFACGMPGASGAALLHRPVSTVLLMQLLRTAHETPFSRQSSKRLQMRLLVDVMCASRGGGGGGAAEGVAGGEDEFAAAAVALLSTLHALAGAVPGDDAVEGGAAAAAAAALATDLALVGAAVRDARWEDVRDGVAGARLVAAFAACPDRRVSSLAAPALRPAFEALAAGPSRRAAGSLWVHVGVLRAWCLVPSRPVDPVVEHQILEEDARAGLEDELLRLQVGAWAARLGLAGAGHPAASRAARASAAAHRAAREEHSRGVSLRPDRTAAGLALGAPAPRGEPGSAAGARRGRNAPFRALFEDLRKFVTSMVDPEKLGRLVARLGASSAPRDRMEAGVWFSSADSFVAHAAARFPRYMDVLLPFANAVRTVQYGLSLLALDAAAPAAAPAAGAHDELLRELLSFPVRLASPERLADPDSDAAVAGAGSAVLLDEATLRGLDELAASAADAMREHGRLSREARQRAAEGVSTAAGDETAAALDAAAPAVHVGGGAGSAGADIRDAVRLVAVHRARLVAAAESPEGGCPRSVSTLRALDAVFREAVSAWADGEQERQRAAAAREAMYKYRAQTHGGDDETRDAEEEAAMLEMYPDFADSFADLAPLSVEEEERSIARRRAAREAAEAAAAAAAAAATEGEGSSPEAATSATLPDSSAERVYELFCAVFDDTTAPASAPAGVARLRQDAVSAGYRSAGAVLRALLLRQWHRSGGDRLAAGPDADAGGRELDEYSVPGHLYMLTGTHREFTVSDGQAAWLAGGSDKKRKKKKKVSLYHRGRRPAGVRADAVPEELLLDIGEEKQSAAAKAATPPSASSLYRDPNPAELRLLERPLALFLQRLKVLLAEFEEQPMLVQLVRVANRLGELPASSPVMKVLAGLEVLLRKSEEWESYTSRRYSIKRELTALWAVVARWRKAELSTWAQALRDRERASRGRARQWWFHLYRLIHVTRGELRGFARDGVPAGRAFLEELHKALDDFVQRCTVGEVVTRLRLLRAFQRQVCAEIAVAAESGDDKGDGDDDDDDDGCTSEDDAGRLPSARLRLRVAFMLGNVCAYYQQFLPAVRRFVAGRRSPIEKKLRDQAKLARWDMSTYWALKEASQKSHRAVFRLARAYQEEVLDTPFRSVIISEEDADAGPGDSRPMSEADAHIDFGEAGRELEAAVMAAAGKPLARLRRDAGAAAAALDEARRKAGEASKKEKDKVARRRMHGIEPAADAGQAEDAAVKGAAEADRAAARALDEARGEAQAEAPRRMVVELPPVAASRVPAGAADDGAPVVPGEPSASPLSGSHASVLRKLQRLLGRSVLGEAYARERLEAAVELERLSTTVIARADGLRRSAAKTARKKKALVDLLKAMRGWGLSHSSSRAGPVWLQAATHGQLFLRGGGDAAGGPSPAEVEAEGRLVQGWDEGADGWAALHYALPPLGPAVAQYLDGARTGGRVPERTADEAAGLSSRMGHYTVRLVSGMRKLRSRATRHHHDLSRSEIAHSKGYSEHLFALVSRQRAQLAVLCRSALALGQWARVLGGGGGGGGEDDEGGDWTWFRRFEVLLLHAREQLASLVALYAQVSAVTTDQATRRAASAAGTRLEAALAGTERARELLAGAAGGLRLATDGPMCRPVYGPHAAAAVRAGGAATLLAVADAAEGAAGEGLAEGLPFFRGGAAAALAECLGRVRDAACGCREWHAARASAAAVAAAGPARRSDTPPREVARTLDEFEAAHRDASRQLLLCAQQLHKACSEGGEPAGLVADEDARVARAVSALRAHAVNERLDQLSAAVARLYGARGGAPSASRCARRLRLLAPLVEQVSRVADRVLLSALRAHKGTCKLAHVVLSVFNALYSRGFCRRPDEKDDDGEDGEQEEGDLHDDLEGTGMAEGEGKRDVSDQITDEEQLLGLRDEDKPEPPPPDQSEQPDKKEAEDPDEGLEMNEDFDGEMFDMPKEQDPGPDDDDEGEDEREELEREFGDTGDDDNVVDEKLWNESDDEEDGGDDEDKKQQDEKYERDAPIKGGDDEVELMAKEDADEQPDDKKKKEEGEEDDRRAERKEDGGGGDEEGEEEEGEGEEEEEDDLNDRADPMVNEAGDDRYEDKHDADPMEFPEDMRLDDDEPGGDDEEKGGDDDGDDAGDDDDSEGAHPDDDMLDRPMPVEEEAKEEKEDAGEEDGSDRATDQPAPPEDGDDAGGADEEEKKEDADNEEDDPDAEDAEARAVEVPPAQHQPEDGPDEDEEAPDRPDEPKEDTAAADDEDEESRAERVAGGEDAMDDADGNDEDEKDGADDEADAGDDDDATAPDMRPQDGGANQRDQAMERTASEDQGEASLDRSRQQEDRSAQPPPPADQGDEGDAERKQQRQKPREANPYQSLGDALRRWQERLAILERRAEEGDDKREEDDDDEGAADDDKQEPDDGDEEAAPRGQFEHAGEDEDADAQALAPAVLDDDHKDESVPRLPEKEEEEEEEEEEEGKSGDKSADMDVDDAAAADDAENDDDDKDRPSRQSAADKRRERRAAAEKDGRDDNESEEEAGDESDGAEEDLEMAHGDGRDDYVERLFAEQDNDEEEVDAGPSRPPPIVGSGVRDDGGAAGDEKEEEEEEGDGGQEEERRAVTAEEVQAMQEALDEDLARFAAGGAGDGDAAARGHDLWQRLRLVTSDLSQTLCEQLRALLEPMLATKLMGDYRTGKRINIKKVIPYVASNFRRDKIWLRRTRPNKRHYQVVVAIDDSESMRSNSGGRLALEALSVLCNAMSQLEVGELGVVSFGDRVRMLHSFDQPFSDQSGAYAASQFTFCQQKTRWPHMLERLVGMLRRAREVSSQAREEHLQLAFVISDARVQQDREAVARWTREAMHSGQLLVLIVVDSRQPNQSILNLRSVSYPNGKVKITEYLDNFPFPYYIVLQDISALPEIIAGALRQWFELIQRAT